MLAERRKSTRRYRSRRNRVVYTCRWITVSAWIIFCSYEPTLYGHTNMTWMVATFLMTKYDTLIFFSISMLWKTSFLEWPVCQIKSILISSLKQKCQAFLTVDYFQISGSWSGKIFTRFIWSCFTGEYKILLESIHSEQNKIGSKLNPILDKFCIDTYGALAVFQWGEIDPL